MRYIVVFIVLLSLCGCESPADYHKVKVVSVWTQADYDAASSWGAPYPHIIVESEDGKRYWMKYNFSKLGDEFTLNVNAPNVRELGAL